MLAIWDAMALNLAAQRLLVPEARNGRDDWWLAVLDTIAERVGCD